MFSRSIPILASALVLSGVWGCGQEERTIVTSAELDLVRGDGAAEHVGLEARWPEVHADGAAFGRVWQVVAGGGAPVEAVAVTFTGGGEADAGGVAVLVGLVLVIPAPIRAGETWNVTGTRVPPGEEWMPLYWDEWGGRTLSRAGEAEIALRTFDYHTIGGARENQFVATEVIGTLSVLARYDELVELAMELELRDASSRVARLSGTLRLWGERYTPPV